MTIYELITTQKKMLTTMHRNGISTDSLRWLKPYERYLELMAQGHKKSYSIEAAAEEHNIKPRWMYCIVNFMGDQVVG